MARNMNTSQARVIDPILSTHAQGYRNAEMIGHVIFPIANIPVRGMRVLKFGKESFRMKNSGRAPGGNTARVQYGYASDPVALVQDALEAVVPDEISEEASKVPGVDLASGSVDMVLDVFALGQEKRIADLVRDPAKYGANNKLALTGSDKWSDPSSDPSADVDIGKEQIRARIGRYPNLLTLGAQVFNVLKNHPKIKEQFKYTSSQSLTADMLAKYFNVDKVIVGQAVYLPENASDDEDAQDVWGNDAILSFTPTGSNFRVPAFGYTYRLNGHPLVETPYRERNAKSWIYPVTLDWSPELVGPDGGFLFQTPI